MACEAIGRRVLRGPEKAAAMVLCGLFLATGAGCSLLLDFGEKADAGPADAAAVIDSAIGGDGGDPCVAYEPNDALADALPIVAGTYEPLAICPAGDDDYYSFTITDNQDVVVEALFSNQGGAGDLEMRLYDDAGVVVDRSETFTDNERIERSLAESNQLLAGTYIVQVYGYNDTTENNYSLVLTITSP